RVEIAHVIGVDVRGDLPRVEDDIPLVPLGLDGEHLELAAGLQVGLVVRHKAVEEAVRLPSAVLGRAADVLDDPQVTVPIRLDSLVAPGAENAGAVLALGGEAGRRLPHAATGAAFRREE